MSTVFLQQYSPFTTTRLKKPGILRECGLCDPDTVIDKGIDEIGNLMKKAGYDRGGITYIIAERVHSLMASLHDGLLDELPEVVNSDKKDKAVDLLVSIKGIGPKSAASAWMLLS